MFFEFGVEWVFEDPGSAEKTLKSFKEVLGNALKKSRNTDGNILTAVAVDWRGWRTLMIAFHGRPTMIDMIAEKYLRQKSRERAFRELAEDLALITMEADER